jgi:hypothetical protein
VLGLPAERIYTEHKSKQGLCQMLMFVEPRPLTASATSQQWFPDPQFLRVTQAQTSPDCPQRQTSQPAAVDSIRPGKQLARAVGSGAGRFGHRRAQCPRQESAQRQACPNLPSGITVNQKHQQGALGRRCIPGSLSRKVD